MSAPESGASSVLTESARKLVGVRGTPVTAPAPISEEQLRRFMHGVMERNPIHLDREVAAQSRYGGLVATPLFPGHTFVRPLNSPDPFDRLRDDPDEDGTFVGSMKGNGLPPVDLPLRRLLNGGVKAEFFQLAKVGDLITAQSEYVDISERTSRNGEPMVLIKVATSYTNQDGELLVVVTSTIIRR